MGIIPRLDEIGYASHHASGTFENHTLAKIEALLPT
jgi:hypothetical protein